AVARDGDRGWWQRDDELCAALRVADCTDRAAVSFDDLSGDRQPETAAAAATGPRAVDLEEALEDAWQIVGGDDGACVVHADADVSRPQYLRADVDRATGRRVADGVVDEVREDLLEPALVAVDERYVAGAQPGFNAGIAELPLEA